MKYLFAAACLFCSLQGIPQLFPPAAYPRNYFRNPLAIPMSLAANFGELRPNHYHMGLDIRTQHRVNLPVYAAADGYIARVSVEPGGFGQAIYINHPNGYTTVYGHLNAFFPALAAYVSRQQYRLQSWQVNLEIPAALFPVKKGGLIAQSGSTGGSQGPHLHFEIRRTKEDINLNPLLFGLPVADHTAPHLVRLAWYDRNRGIYEQSPHEVPVEIEGPRIAEGSASRSTVEMKTRPSLLSVGATRISFAISAFDTQSGSDNPNGIFEASLYEDERPVIGFQLNNISYDDTRNINAHIDYKTKETGGPYFQQLFFLQGYPLPTIYSTAGDGTGGVLDIGDGRPHKIRIGVRDTEGNETVLSFGVQYAPSSDTGGASSKDSMTTAVFPAKRFYPGMLDGLEMADCAFYPGERSLYDSVIIGAGVAGYPGSGLSLPGGVSAVYRIGEPWIPLLDPVLVRMRPVSPGDSLRGVERMDTTAVVMVGFHGASREVERPTWKNGWASARYREFGDFQLVRDTVPPVVSFPGAPEGALLNKASRIRIAVRDNLGATRHFRAELDGAWLCFTNDKGLDWIYRFDEHCLPGPHTLRVSVEDVAGNRTIKELHFTR
jgi:hypothetical protein